MLNASKILAVALATCLLGACVVTPDGRAIIDVRVEGNETGHYTGQDRGYCYYRYPSGRTERVYRSGYRHDVCPRTILREAEEHRGYRRDRRY